MENTTRTAYGANFQTSLILQKPVQLLENTTLNQKHNIQNGSLFADTDKPGLFYVGCGNGGHIFKTGATGIPYPEPIPHSPRHAGLYNQLPWVIRTLDNDLDLGSLANYRLRKLETINGVQYAAYYLKRLDLTLSDPALQYMIVTDTNTQSQPFVPTLDDLNPSIDPLFYQGQNTTTGDYIRSTAQVNFSLTAGDVAELINVSNVKYGDDSYSIISELAFCTGADRTVTGTVNGSTVPYLEAIGVQICHFSIAYISLKHSTNGVEFVFDLGNVEPLFILNPT